MTERQCTKCNAIKPETDFSFQKPGKRRSQCKPCRAILTKQWAARKRAEYGEFFREYRQRPDVKARKNERARQRYAEDPTYRDLLLARNRQVTYKFTLKKRYGITLEGYLAMLDAQKLACLICKCDLTALGTRKDGTTYTRAHVDHDHMTGKTRGLLCSECNVGLGKFADDPRLLRAAAEYLESFAAHAP